jgi:hypothetical protein
MHGMQQTKVDLAIVINENKTSLQATGIFPKILFNKIIFLKYAQSSFISI